MPTAPVEQFCRRCATIVARHIDKTPGSARAYSACNCPEGKPYFPLFAVTDRNRDTLARKF